MRRTLSLLVGLALIGAACGSDDEAEATPAIVIDGGATEPPTAETANGAETADAGPGAQPSGELAASGAVDDSAPSSADASSEDLSDEQLALNFAQCMRDNGLPEFPDPTIAADGSVSFGGPDGPAGVDTQSTAFQDAVEQCADLLTGASFLPGANLSQTEIEDNLLAFAECMRDLGFDLDDPNIAAIGPGAGPSSIFGDGFDPDDPATADAAQECQSVFGPGFPAGGTN